MKNVIINDWIALDMIGYLYFAICAVSETEWWIIAPADSYEEAREKMEADKATAEEDFEAEWMVIDFMGRKVEG